MAPTAREPTEVCPGCGAVLVHGDGPSPRAGASASCARLFEVTLHGLREQAAGDPAAATTVRRADATYDAQHADPGHPERLRAALEVLGVPPDADRTPEAWRTTIADVAADLDVIDLAVLVDAWAAAVTADRVGAGATRR